MAASCRLVCHLPRPAARCWPTGAAATRRDRNVYTSEHRRLWRNQRATASSRVTPGDVMNRLRRGRWVERQGKGSHMVFLKEGRVVVVSNHPGDIKPGTLHSAVVPDGNFHRDGKDCVTVSRVTPLLPCTILRA